MLTPRCLVPGLLVGALMFAGCPQKTPESGPKSYPLEGTVIAVDRAERKITIDHKEIPGFMAAMTMDFVLLPKDAALLAYGSQFTREEGEVPTLINDPGFLESIRARDRFFGELAGCTYAEPYRALELLRIGSLDALLPGERKLLDE